MTYIANRDVNFTSEDGRVHDYFTEGSAYDFVGASEGQWDIKGDLVTTDNEGSEHLASPDWLAENFTRAN